MEAPEYVRTEEQELRWKVCSLIAEGAGEGEEFALGLYFSDVATGADAIAEHELEEALALPFNPAKHLRGRAGKFADMGRRYEASLGATPFRPEDNAEGFYAGEKAKQFDADLAAYAKQFGVKVKKKERVTGVWLGETEPAFDVTARDGEEGVKKLAEAMRAKYDQDAVLIFHPDPKGSHVSYTLPGVGEAAALKALKKSGIPGGRMHGDDLEIIGEENIAETVIGLAKELGSRLATKRGSFALVSR